MPPVSSTHLEESPPPLASIAPIADPACENVTFPSAGASVLIIPGAMMTRALMPVVRAACSCSRSGERVRLTAVIVPEAGSVTAVAQDNEAANACIQRTIDGRFDPPFELGSDCIDCGPKRFPIFHGSAPPAPRKPEPSRITYPFTLVHP